MKPIVYAVCAVVLLAAAPAADERPETVRSCEPSGPLDLYAKALEIRGNGSEATVNVELTIFPHSEIEGAVIRGTLANGVGFDRAFGIPDRVATLRRKVARKVQYSINLERGKDHELFFHVQGERPEGTLVSSAYLRVNLDPSTRPEILEDVIEYRAVMQELTP